MIQIAVWPFDVLRHRRSALPSPLKSAVVTDCPIRVGDDRGCGGWRHPTHQPQPRRAVHAVHRQTRSVLPSPLKSVLGGAGVASAWLEAQRSSAPAASRNGRHRAIRSNRGMNTFGISRARTRPDMQKSRQLWGVPPSPDKRHTCPTGRLAPRMSLAAGVNRVRASIPLHYRVFLHERLFTMRTIIGGAIALAMLANGASAVSLLPQQVYGTFGYTSGAFVAIYGAGASWDLKPRPPARDESGLGIRLDGQVAYWWGKGKLRPRTTTYGISARRRSFAGLSPSPKRRACSSKAGSACICSLQHASTTTASSAPRSSSARWSASARRSGLETSTKFAFTYSMCPTRGIKMPNWGLTYPGITFSYALP